MTYMCRPAHGLIASKLQPVTYFKLSYISNCFCLNKSVYLYFVFIQARRAKSGLLYQLHKKERSTAQHPGYRLSTLFFKEKYTCSSAMSVCTRRPLIIQRAKAHYIEMALMHHNVRNYCKYSTFRHFVSHRTAADFFVEEANMSSKKDTYA